MSNSASDHTIPDNVRTRLLNHADEKTNAEAVIVEATDSGTCVRLLYHPPTRRPIIAPADNGRERTSNHDAPQTLVVMGAAQEARKLSYDEVVERFTEISNADHIDYLDFDHHYEVQLTYETDAPEW